MGFSDLHCNQAMTELIKIGWPERPDPSLIISSGDDTVNGTAVERGCIRREAQIASGVPVPGGDRQPRLRRHRGPDAEQPA